MTGILLFIVLPLVVLIVGGIAVAFLSGSNNRDESGRGGIGNNFIDWML